MRVKRLNSQKEVLINVNKYKINWDSDGASKLEVKFRNLIRPYWYRSIILYQFKIPASLLRIDFFNVNKRLAIEVNGPQHNEFNPHFHRHSRAAYRNSIMRDFSKIRWCEENNIQLLELIEEDLDNFSRE